ncbi:MAG TPA: PQQ-dependent sugar dehydrogenase [Trueperaceae bacterium]|nr:PQQ-dependent sugar dehydrogenase [Trueperaceae bacterium]
MRTALLTTTSALVMGLVLACSATAQRLDRVAAGFDSPVAITNAGDERVFVVEQGGVIKVMSDGVVADAPFLDISDRVTAGGERGLLGLAFPPDHAASGRYYVYYTDTGGNTVVSRFVASGDTTDPASEQVLLRQEQPFSNHNGGQIAFGPEGYLYIGLGDGGSGGDPQGNGQNLGTFLGKLLRIDVAGEAYTVPDDNPFVGQDGALPEIWAYGLRNPWRFSFDSATGELFIADVGQNAFEEVNLQPAGSAGGENYGWNVMEAESCFEPREGCDQTGLAMPIIAYPHGGEWGASISGGYVYHGPDAPSLEGAYVFADYVSGRIWTARADNDWQPELLLDSGFNISTFGVGTSGELYVADHGGGAIYLLSD